MKYDMLTTPVTTDKFRHRVLRLLKEYLCGRTTSCTISSLTPEDSDLCPGEETTSVIAVTSPWIDLCSTDPTIFNVSKQVLDLEIAYAAFCGIGNIIISGFQHNGEAAATQLSQFAYAIKDALEIGNFYQLQLRLPMLDDSAGDTGVTRKVKDECIPKDNEDAPTRKANTASRRRDDSKGSLADYERSESIDTSASVSLKKKDPFATWDSWNMVRSVCLYSTRLSVALDVPKSLPPNALRSRWFSEPVRILLIGGNVFSKNKVGFPALPAGHQALISHYMRVRQPPWLLLSDADSLANPEPPENQESVSWTVDGSAFPTPAEATLHQTQNERSDLVIHIDYMRHFQRKQEPLTAIEQFSSSYQDYLQSPLQPLADNLESVTYEVFEKDPIKYNQYEKAMTVALEDWVRDKKPLHRKDRVVVAIVGAGRGPLVTRALRASEISKVDIELWAVEKNPNAFVLLQRHNKETWNGRVNLVQSDMRCWNGPAGAGPARLHNYTIDILVSELLGSFADNELSPECLDAVTPLLTPDHGISIPRSYTSFLTPIATPKIHADLLARSGTDASVQCMPWVSMLHSFDFLSSKGTITAPEDRSDQAGKPLLDPLVLRTWSFEHGPPDAEHHTDVKPKTRQCRVNFPIQDRAVCHGFAGYFEAELYPGVELSTNPLNMQEKSPDMTSWFPIFFPLKVSSKAKFFPPRSDAKYVPEPSVHP